MEVKPFDGRGYRLGGDGPLTSSALSADPNQTTSQFAALSEDPHTQSSFGSAQTPLLFNESMEFCAAALTLTPSLMPATAMCPKTATLMCLRTLSWRSSGSSGMSRSLGCFDWNNTRTPQRLSSKSMTLWWERRCFCLFPKVSRSLPRKLPPCARSRVDGQIHPVQVFRWHHQAFVDPRVR